MIALARRKGFICRPKITSDINSAVHAACGHFGRQLWGDGSARRHDLLGFIVASLWSYTSRWAAEPAPMDENPGRRGRLKKNRYWDHC